MSGRQRRPDTETATSHTATTLRLTRVRPEPPNSRMNPTHAGGSATTPRYLILRARILVARSCPESSQAYDRLQNASVISRRPYHRARLTWRRDSAYTARGISTAGPAKRATNHGDIGLSSIRGQG